MPVSLKTLYDTVEDIPEGYTELYTERNGKWELSGVVGVKTQADIDRVQGALVKERGEHKATKALLLPFEGLDAEVIHLQATELEETKAQLDAIKKDGSIDETKLEPIIAARVKQAVAPLDRDRLALERKLEATNKIVAERDGEVLSLKTTIVSGTVERAIRDAAIEAKVVPTAISDAVLQGNRVFEATDDSRVITKDVAGTVPGLTPREWFKDMQEKSPHWWPPSVGGGSRGGPGGPSGKANNPWSREAWNVTAQGAYIKEYGPEKGKTLAESVGSHIGATKPAAAAA
jgi:hypothetical protein